MLIKNAKIDHTMFGREDHGIMTFSICISTAEYSCWIGNYAIDCYDRETESRKFTAKGLEAISKILEVVGVDTWEELPGKYIRIKDSGGWGSTVDEIGNLIEDEWFNIREFFSKGE